MFVFSICRLVSRRCHNISTLYPLAPAPHRQNRTCRFSASGSSGRLTDRSLIADSVLLIMLSQVLCPALSPFLDTPASQSLPSTATTRLPWYYGLIRLPVPHPQNLVSSVPSTPLQRKIQVLPGFWRIPSTTCRGL